MEIKFKKYCREKPDTWKEVLIYRMNHVFIGYRSSNDEWVLRDSDANMPAHWDDCWAYQLTNVEPED